jgi:hypothetical protein
MIARYVCMQQKPSLGEIVEQIFETLVLIGFALRYDSYRRVGRRHGGQGAKHRSNHGPGGWKRRHHSTARPAHV